MRPTQALALLWLLLVVAAVARQATAQEARPASSAGAAASTPASVSEVLDRYVRALGGAAALRAHTSRSARGEWENETRGVRFPIEVHAAAPDRWVELLDASENEGVTGRGYDGSAGWSSNLTETGLRVLSGPELEARRREAQFDRPLRLAELYPQLALRGVESVDGRDHVVLVARAGTGSPETWFFDAETGLLVRRDLVLDGPFGPWPVSERYLDYREIDGVKLPMRIRAEASVTVEVRFREIRHDQPIDDSLFAAPGRGGRHRSVGQ